MALCFPQLCTDFIELVGNPLLITDPGILKNASLMQHVFDHAIFVLGVLVNNFNISMGVINFKVQRLQLFSNNCLENLV